MSVITSMSFSPICSRAVTGTACGEEAGSRGEPIGDHDAWIAALALQHGHSVATAKDRHFKRVANLAVRTY